jgi:hypothetical protein
VTTVPDIPVVRIPALEGESLPDSGLSMPSHVSWAAVDVPRGRRPSPIVLAILGVLAGIGAMALGAVAVISAGTSPGTTAHDGPAAPTTSRTVASTSGVERQVLALLAKPSTERLVFRGSGGRLVLAVGSGGRAAILIRGLERAAPGKPYRAWLLTPDGASIRAAEFVGTERAVFLSVGIGPRASVVVSTERPVPGRPTHDRVIAARG